MIGRSGGCDLPRAEAQPGGGAEEAGGYEGQLLREIFDLDLTLFESFPRICSVACRVFKAHTALRKLITRRGNRQRRYSSMSRTF